MLGMERMFYYRLLYWRNSVKYKHAALDSGWRPGRGEQQYSPRRAAATTRPTLRHSDCQDTWFVAIRAAGDTLWSTTRATTELAY